MLCQEYTTASSSADLPLQSRLSDITINCCPNILVSNIVTRADHGQFKYLLALSRATDKCVNTLDHGSNRSERPTCCFFDIGDNGSSSCAKEKGACDQEGDRRLVQQRKSHERRCNTRERSTTNRGRTQSFEEKSHFDQCQRPRGSRYGRFEHFQHA